jgi:adenine phosphoribosyltransferase
MPGLSGLQVQAELNARKIVWPVVVLTGRGDVRIAVEAMKNGAVEFLEKPYEPAALAATLDAAFEGFEAKTEARAEVARATALIEKLSNRELEVMRGLLAGMPNKIIAYALGLGQLMLRKPGKLPGEKIGIDYTLEYGTDRIEMHVGHVRPDQKVLLVDDLIATGGTALAGVDLIRQGGGKVEQALFIVDLPDLGGAEKLRRQNIRVDALIGFDGD